MNSHLQSDRSSQEEPPPIFKAWREMYLTVLGNLVLMIVVFYLITNYFS